MIETWRSKNGSRKSSGGIIDLETTNMNTKNRFGKKKSRARIKKEAFDIQAEQDQESYDDWTSKHISQNFSK